MHYCKGQWTPHVAASVLAVYQRLLAKFAWERVPHSWQLPGKIPGSPIRSQFRIHIDSCICVNSTDVGAVVEARYKYQLLAGHRGGGQQVLVHTATAKHKQVSFHCVALVANDGLVEEPRIHLAHTSSPKAPFATRTFLPNSGSPAGPTTSICPDLSRE